MESWRNRFVNPRGGGELFDRATNSPKSRLSASENSRCFARIFSRYKNQIPLPPIGVRNEISGAPSTKGARLFDHILNASEPLCASALALSA